MKITILSILLGFAQCMFCFNDGINEVKNRLILALYLNKLNVTMPRIRVLGKEAEGP